MKLISFCLALLSSSPLYGRIGESEMQCFERYGRKVLEEKNLGHAKQIKFKSAEFEVTGIFINGKAECLEFEKSGELSAPEVRGLLEKNGLAPSLATERRKPVRMGYNVLEEITWTFPDRVAILSALGDTLTISTMAFATALSGADKDSKEETASQSTEGF